MSLPIEKIEDHKYKSWKDGSNLKMARFNGVNIIFGHNGAGKSSLSKGLASNYLKLALKDSARFFSAKYIDATLTLEDKSGIPGVVSNFGEKDVNIEKKVEANKTKIAELATEAAKKTRAIKHITDETDKQIKDIVRRRKDKNKKINNKPENKTVQEKVDLWVKDYDDALKSFPDEDYNSLTGNADFSAESEQVNLLEVPALPQIDIDIYGKLVEILGTEYKSFDIPENDVVSWLKAGVHLHEGKKKCEFCGSGIDIRSIKKRVDLYLNDEKHKATVALEDAKRVLLELADTNETLVDNCASYNKILGLTDGEIDFKDLKPDIKEISGLSESIDKKLGDMSSPFKVNAGALENIMKNTGDALNILVTAKRQSTQNLMEKVNRLEVLVKGAIGLEIKNTSLIGGNLAKLDSNAEDFRKLTGKQTKLEGENVRLLEQKSDLADFAEYLNPTLKDLGLNFELSPSGKVYVLKHSDGAPLKLSDISDGERNLFSLIYFYHEMLSDSSGTFKDTIKLAIIDDPVSSLDDNNKFYITELVRSILDQKTIQVFALTHSWDDFCNLAYGRLDDNTSLFEIKKESSLSNIYSISNQKLLKPYIMLYREVDSFQEKNVSDISDDEALHMPNTMRRILEEYVKFHVNVDFATAAKTGDICKALFKEEQASLSKTKKQKLDQLLSICNILSHKANHPKNPSEIHKSAKFLINTIKQHDKFHHFKMKGD